MIQYKTGNLFNTTDIYIAHGCNAQGVMGSGVAKIVRERYPRAYSIYKFHYDHGGLILGSVNRAYMFNDNKVVEKCIFNCITQKYYGKDGKQYVDYQAVKDSLEQCAWVVDCEQPNGLFNNNRQISIPKIGAGLGGGDWKIIEDIILKIAAKYHVVFNVWTPEN